VDEQQHGGSSPSADHLGSVARRDHRRARIHDRSVRAAVFVLPSARASVSDSVAKHHGPERRRPHLRACKPGAQGPGGLPARDAERHEVRERARLLARQHRLLRHAERLPRDGLPVCPFGQFGDLAEDAEFLEAEAFLAGNGERRVESGGGARGIAPTEAHAGLALPDPAWRRDVTCDVANGGTMTIHVVDAAAGFFDSAGATWLARIGGDAYAVDLCTVTTYVTASACPAGEPARAP
jgi:hypothetical protein